METKSDGRPCIAMELNAKISDEALSWFIDRIKSDRHSHGCQLEVSCQETNNGLKVLVITASDLRLRVGAEIFGINKQHLDGNMRNFSMSDESEFVDYQDDNFIADCEGLYIIKTELDSLRATDEDHIPGHPDIPLYPGKSILRKMKSSKLITTILCLHDATRLDKLSGRWYREKSILTQPINEIREYFGDAIAVYFSFLAYYTKALIPLIALTLTLTLLSNEWSEIYSYSLYAVVNVIWASVFLEMWKIKSAQVAYKFGSFQKREWEDPRNGFHGPLGLNPITGKQEPCYSSWKRQLRMCLISFPCTTLCISVAVWIMFYYFRWDSDFAQKYDDDPAISSKIIRNLPSVAYSCVVLVANCFYRILAEKLTDQENHRLESSYQNHLISKLVLFDFVNNFLCLFYIAFVYEDVKMLRRTLRNLFLIQIIVSQTLESAVPYWQYRRRISSKRDKKEAESTLSQVEVDLKRDVYAGTFDDYLEMWLQFGYVVLFSSVFPMAAVWAFLNNIVEMKSDAFKLCTAFRRPFCNPTRNIGAWQFAMDFIAYLGVVTNCALLFQSAALKNWFYGAYPEATGLDLLVLFFVMEHALLALKAVVTNLIPNVPESIRMKIASVQYKSQQALKRKRAASLKPTDAIADGLISWRAKSSGSNKEESS